METIVGTAMLLTMIAGAAVVWRALSQHQQIPQGELAPLVKGGCALMALPLVLALGVGIIASFEPPDEAPDPLDVELTPAQESEAIRECRGAVRAALPHGVAFDERDLDPRVRHGSGDRWSVSGDLEFHGDSYIPSINAYHCLFVEDGQTSMEVVSAKLIGDPRVHPGGLEVPLED